MSNSVTNMTFRYHPEDEQMEDSYETSSSISTSSISFKAEGANEESSMVTDKTPSQQGKREETDKWKIVRDLKVRITKSVEDKLEEMKSERLIKSQSKRRSILGQMEHSSISDSEEQSESLQCPASDKSPKCVPGSLNISNEKVEKLYENPESDGSGSQGSTTPASSTPVPPGDNIIDSEPNVSVKKGKGVKGAAKRKKSKIKSEKLPHEKTSIVYSALVNKELNTDGVELGEEVGEVTLEHGETRLGLELDRIAHPSLLQQLLTFLYDWHMFYIPLAAIVTHWFIQLPQYAVGCLVGVMGLLVVQRVASMYRWMLGSDNPIKQLKDMLPLTEVPIFSPESCNVDSPHTVYEGWMNEYTREYFPDTYHITLTESVYIRLKGSKLCLSSPRSKIPKRALWNEPSYNLHFNRERVYDISNCCVGLRPERLIHRRIWSKKYPICIVLSDKSRLSSREKDYETISTSTPWVEEEICNFESVSEDSEDEHTVPSKNLDNSEDINQGVVLLEDTVLGELQRSLGEDLSVDNMEEGFVKVAPQQTNQLFLFARSDREKEMWYRRLMNAAGESTGVSVTSSDPGLSSSQSKPPLDYLSFMMALSQRTVAHLPSSKEQNSKNPSLKTDLSISMEMMWLNAFLGRLLFDVFQDADKIVKIQEKIQHKLSAIKLPIFLERLEVTHLDLGDSVPIIQRASRPQLDSRGVWVDLDVVYEGGFTMTIDTKVNLLRIKQMQAESPNSESPKNGSPAKCPSPTPLGCEPIRKSAVYNSSVEDSAETSGDEPDFTHIHDPSTSGQGPVTQHKYLRLLDKVAQSKYIQQLADYKFIKKFVSNNSLQLIVEVKGLLGTLVLNIPPPPSDRVWYGFRNNPKLWLSAYPKFGQTAFHVISRIIEKKLCLEFQRLLVLPNMDDLLIPIMDHNIPS